MNTRQELERRISLAMAAAGAESCPAMVATSANPKFGDYQANGVMAAAKKTKTNPRQLAQKVLDQLQAGGAGDLSDLADKVEIAGPGFINVHLKPEFLSRQLSSIVGDDRLGVDRGTAVSAVSGTGILPVPDSTMDKRRGAYLPHWTQAGAAYAVAFRLADSLPSHVLETWKREREEITARAKAQGRQLSTLEREELHKLYSARVESYLDFGQGSCVLKDPRIAKLVQDALKHFDGQRYDLIAWAVMPNHVHVVLRPLENNQLKDVLHSWKSFTAKEVNRILGRAGQVWQEEYYDHLIRDETDFVHEVNYVLNNPAKAGLGDWAWCGHKKEEAHGQDAHATHGQDARATQTIVIDYSAPNLAKEMHVGHLRSTIIGDALARVLDFQGHNAIRQNHVGDWGTQFGMLLAYLKQLLMDDPTGSVAEMELTDLEVFYRKAKERFDSDPGFAEAAREEVVMLQSGDTATLDYWHRFRELSIRHAERIYEKLGVDLKSENVRGESAYNDDLPNVVADLAKAGLLTESQGAQCVFLPEFTGKDGSPLPLIIQKSDEGYLYATTDLAAIRYRVGTLHAQRVLYVVDARQGLHFRMVFAVARKAGFVPPEVSLEHIGFGVMLGDDGKPFKTRAGGTVKLMDLLDEAVERAYKLVTEKSPESPEEQRRAIAQTVGIGAVKYSDLSQNRNSDYVFSWDKMLALDGNTAPYMQYAYARIRSIFRKGQVQAMATSDLQTSRDRQGAGNIAISEHAERTLAVRLLQFPEVIETVAGECLPNVLCAYLYDLAGAFTTFYESCPVLKSAEPLRSSRLALCDLTARTIQTGLGLLGIRTVEQM